MEQTFYYATYSYSFNIDKGQSLFDPRIADLLTEGII